MSTIDLIQKKVAILPKKVQLQVLDFVNFLADKYGVEEEETILKAFLVKRASLITKDKRVPVDMLRRNVLKKYQEDI